MNEEPTYMKIDYEAICEYPTLHIIGHTAWQVEMACLSDIFNKVAERHLEPDRLYKPILFKRKHTSPDKYTSSPVMELHYQYGCFIGMCGVDYN